MPHGQMTSNPQKRGTKSQKRGHARDSSELVPLFVALKGNEKEQTQFLGPPTKDTPICLRTDVTVNARKILQVNVPSPKHTITTYRNWRVSFQSWLLVCRMCSYESKKKRGKKRKNLATWCIYIYTLVLWEHRCAGRYETLRVPQLFWGWLSPSTCLPPKTDGYPYFENTHTHAPFSGWVWIIVDFNYSPCGGHHLQWKITSISEGVPQITKRSRGTRCMKLWAQNGMSHARMSPKK